MRPLRLLIALSLLPWACSADLSVQSSYFSSGASLHDGLTAFDIDMERQTMLSQGLVVMNSRAIEGGARDESLLSDSISIITINSIGEDLGAGVSMVSEDMAFDNIVVAGVENSVRLTYSHGSGRSASAYSISRASASEEISADNGWYRGTVAATDVGAYSFGTGEVVDDAEGSFDHDLSLTYDGKPCKIVAALDADDEVDGDIPVYYRWTSFAASNQEKGSAEIGIRADDGNRRVDIFMKGVSSALSDKIMDPSALKPVRDPEMRISRDLRIRYEIA